MHGPVKILLPGGMAVEWSLEEAADVAKRITDILLAEATGSAVQPSLPAVAGPLRAFLDSEQSEQLTPGMRTALQTILRQGPVSAGDLAEVGVFNTNPPSGDAIKRFRTRTNVHLIEAGLTLSYSGKTHLLTVTPIEWGQGGDKLSP